MNNNSEPSIFGKGLQLKNGDLHFLNGDFAVVSDRANFMQAMQVMIETPAGTDIFNVNYGFDLINSISQPQSINQLKALIRLNIVKSLSLDDRVQEIKEIAFDDESRFFELNPQQNFEARRQIRRTERRWQATVVVQTISEGEVVLNLTGVGL